MGLIRLHAATRPDGKNLSSTMTATITTASQAMTTAKAEVYDWTIVAPADFAWSNVAENGISRTATPRALPTRCMVLRTPDAAPVCRSGISERTALTTGV